MRLPGDLFNATLTSLFASLDLDLKSTMPRKRKADVMKVELEPIKKAAKNEEHEESLLPQYLEPRQKRQVLDLSHAHPDEPLPSVERTKDWLLSSSPTERHVKRRSRISKDLLNVDFPRDENGYIAKVKEAVPGRDVSPNAAYLRSDGSPIPYNSQDYGSPAASTPSRGIDAEPQYRGPFESDEDQLGSGQEDTGDYEKSEEPSMEPSSIGTYEEDPQRDFEEGVQDDSEKPEDSLSSSALPPFTSLSALEVDHLAGSAPQLNLVVKASIMLSSALALENDRKNGNGEGQAATSEQTPLGSPFPESNKNPMPFRGISGESDFEEAADSDYHHPESSQGYGEDYEKLSGPVIEAYSVDNDGKDGQQAFDVSDYDLSELSEGQGQASKGPSSNHSLLDSSGISWDHGNAGPERMLGRRPLPLPAPTSDSTTSSPEKSPHNGTEAQARDGTATILWDDTSVGSSVNVRGGLLERIRNTRLYRYRPRVRAPGVEISILLFNFDILGTVGNIPAPISRSMWHFGYLFISMELHKTTKFLYFSHYTVFYSSSLIVS